MTRTSPRRPGMVQRCGMLHLAVSRILIAACCFAVGLLTTPTNAGRREAEAEAKLDAAYTAMILGVPIGRISWTVEVRHNQFAAAANGATTGLLRVFRSGRGIAQSHGSLSARQPIASYFVVSYVSGQSSDGVKIVFSGGKAKESLTHPPKPNPNLVPLTEAYRVGVVDPMTALLIDVPGVGNTAAPAACERKIAVFDGRMRFDLKLAFKRLETVQADTGYRGPAVVCAVYFSPLAGYDPGRSAIKYLKAEHGIEVWLAPLAGTRLVVPFRISVPTPIGLGVLQATRFVSIPLGRSAGMKSN